MKKIIAFIFALLLAFLVYQFIFKDKDKMEETKETAKFKYADILNNTKGEVSVNTFTIYGKHLNLKGEVLSNSKNMEIVLKNEKEEIPVKIDVKEIESSETEKKYQFQTSEYINDGINLEKMALGEYLFLLKNQDTGEYYTLINKTKYKDNNYYTMTKNKKNNHITFPESTYQNKVYWTIKIQEEKLPEEYYDVIIDPGHGGTDTGAVNGKYQESKFNLDYAKTLKEALEEEGIKVRLTREEDEQIEHYGVGSRTGIPYETKAKLMLSLHLNSSNSKKEHGVEIYRAYYDNNDYAKLLADNITKYTETDYSVNTVSRILKGVYMRKYSKSDIASFIKDAKKKGYEPYDYTDDLTYYYFIRETGGIMTKAFSDGRNPKYKYPNPYRDYNQGVEAYLCELAYISNTNDIKNILNKKDGYIKALKESVLSYVNNTESV